MQLTRGRRDVVRTVDNRFQYLDSSGMTEDVILLGQIDGRVPTEFDTVLNVGQHKKFSSTQIYEEICTNDVET